MKSDNAAELSVPAALIADIQAAADDEHRPATEIVRDALERYLAEWRKGGASRHVQAGRTPAEAAARMREQRVGNILPEGVTIRDLMTHGRA